MVKLSESDQIFKQNSRMFVEQAYIHCEWLSTMVWHYLRFSFLLFCIHNTVNQANNEG